MTNMIKWCRVATMGVVAGLFLLVPDADAVAQQGVAPQAADTIVLSLEDARRLDLSQYPTSTGQNGPYLRCTGADHVRSLEHPSKGEERN